MATKPAQATETATAEQDGETSLLDVQSTAVKRLMAKGKERGYITFDELNAVLPPDQMSTDQIEDVMSQFSELGVQVVENEETEETEEPEAPEAPEASRQASSSARHRSSQADALDALASSSPRVTSISPSPR